MTARCSLLAARCSLLAIALMVAGPAEAQMTLVLPSANQNYLVNTPSFQNQLQWIGAGPSEIARTISFAANHWAAYAGSHIVFTNLGETAQIGCTTGYPLIVAAINDCDPDGYCSGRAHHKQCSNGGSEIIFYTGLDPSRRWTVGTPVTAPGIPAGEDVTGIAVHEFGHALFAGPGEDNGEHFAAATGPGRCMLGAGELHFVGPCVKEVRTVGRVEFGLAGPGFLNEWLAESAALGWNNPLVWTAPTNTSVLSGIGGGALAIGLDFFNPSAEWVLNAATKVYVSQASAHPVQLAPSNGAWEYTIASDAVGRPTIVFDHTRSAWWMFVRKKDELNRVHVYKHFPGFPPWAWEDHGILDASPALRIESAYPVAVAYDATSTNLVMVWSSSESIYEVGGTCHNYSAFPHCRNEILAAMLVPNSGSVGLTVTDVRRFTVKGAPIANFGYVGLGSPSIVCEPSLSSVRCEVYAVNWTQFKEIVDWRICINGASFCGYTIQHSERLNSPGETDFPIGVSVKRPDGSGYIVEAVTGTDRNIWYRMKANVADPVGRVRWAVPAQWAVRPSNAG